MIYEVQLLNKRRKIAKAPRSRSFSRASNGSRSGTSIESKRTRFYPEIFSTDYQRGNDKSSIVKV